MTQKITDLDALVGAPRKVRLSGTIYKLPADCPTPLLLKSQHYHEERDNDEDIMDLIEELYDEYLGLFRVYQPDLETLPIGIAQMIALIPAVYNDRDDEDSGAERPTQARKGRKTKAQARKNGNGSKKSRS